ncbi:IS1634 family transposase [uncultured Methanolobus sp.]|uniref:IS1634 family transposase n=1 Tax=uncultured Methanolobus sp. TaxID=218300 RepID=UPI0029C97932|nr:IS1634 family transposase [uncultured Methanolobus sp.]
MKSTLRIKKINGIEYWYEDIPYYDKEKKQIRHRSKYLGRNVNGKPVRIRDAMNSTEETFLPSSKPIKAYNYGELLPLQKIIEELKIGEYLGDLLNEKDRNMILAMVLNRITRPTAMYNLTTWYENSALSIEDPELPLKSQNISNLLAKVGDSDIPSTFIGKMLRNLGTKRTLVYDLTSLSSHSQLINLLEYGYSRDDPELPQLNISMILDKEKGVPVMYDIYPGSIVDVTTLKNTIKKIEAYGVNDYTLIMDRGFFSTGNIEELLHEKVPFIMPATMMLKSVKELMSLAQKDIENPEYLHKFNKKPIFAKPVTLEQEEFKLNGYCFYDPKRELEEKGNFYSRLYDVKEHLEQKGIPGWRKAEEVFKERARDMVSFYSWEIVDDHFRIGIKKNAVSQRINRMGKFFLFYNGERDWLDCLTVYRERDVVEKGFKVMKKDIQSLPLNTHKDSTTKGFIFICFIGLMIRMRLLKMMKETGIIEDHTVESLLLELEKIRKIEMQNGEVIVTELTRKQKEILGKMELCA